MTRPPNTVAGQRGPSVGTTTNALELSDKVIMFLRGTGHRLSEAIENGLDDLIYTETRAWPPTERRAPQVCAQNLSLTDAVEPGYEPQDMFLNALAELDTAYRALGDAQDWLRSDWRPAGTSLTDAQGDARSVMQDAIADAKTAINRAKDAADRAGRGGQR